MLGSKYADYAAPLLVVVGVLVLWELLVVALDVPVYILPTPSEILGALFSGRVDWASAFWITFYESAFGFVLGVAVAIPLSIAIAASAWLNRALYPLIIALQVVPKVALAPILFIMIGFGDVPRIIVVFLSAFFPLVMDTVAGLNALDPEYVDLLRGVGASNYQIFFKGRLPNALPYVFTGFKVSITLAVIGAVVAEFVESSAGLGFILLQSLTQFGTVIAFASLALLTGMGYALFIFFLALERVSIPWYIKSKRAHS